MNLLYLPSGFDLFKHMGVPMYLKNYTLSTCLKINNLILFRDSFKYLK